MAQRDDTILAQNGAISQGSVALGSCGSGATLQTGSVQGRGGINIGSGSPTTCSVSFSPGFPQAALCVLQLPATGASFRNAVVSTSSPTGFTATFVDTTGTPSGISSELLAYHCQ